jgi:hypothetical protein
MTYPICLDDLRYISIPLFQLCSKIVPISFRSKGCIQPTCDGLKAKLLGTMAWIMGQLFYIDGFQFSDDQVLQSAPFPVHRALCFQRARVRLLQAIRDQDRTFDCLPDMPEMDRPGRVSQLQPAIRPGKRVHKTNVCQVGDNPPQDRPGDLHLLLDHLGWQPTARHSPGQTEHHAYCVIYTTVDFEHSCFATFTKTINIYQNGKDFPDARKDAFVTLLA